MRLAVLEVGSNAIRLASAVWHPSGTLELVLRQHVPLRLGETVFSSGGVSDAALQKLCDALGQLLQQLSPTPQDRLQLCATSALRDANNLLEIRARLQHELGLLLLYEQGYLALKGDKKRGPLRRQFARETASMAEYLKKTELALEWLEQVDEGGRSDLELQAIYLQVRHFREIGHLKTASTRLYKVLKRNLPLSSRWFAIFNYERAEVLQLRAGNTNEVQFWENSLKRYKLVLRGKKLKETEQLHTISRKRAQEIEAYLKALKTSEG